MKNYRLGILLIAVAAILLAAVYVGCSKEDDNSTNNVDYRDEWTILSYGAGNHHGDTTGGESTVIDHVQAMEEVVGSDKVNVVAMVSSMATGGTAKYYQVEHDTGSATGDVITSTVRQDLGARNMAAAQTLKDFLNYGILTYPAKKYMVIIDGTGDGWRGVCRDDLNGNGTSMTVATLAQALNEVRTARGIGSFAIVCFTGASMSMTEVAYELRDAAQFLVATEYKTDLDDVLAPELWLDSLSLVPTTDAATVAEIIVDLSFESAGVGGYHHMAAIQLSQVANLISKVGDLASALSTEATAYWDEVKNARIAVHATNIYDSSYVDLGLFVERLKVETNLQNILSVTTRASAVTTALDAAVPTSRTSVSGMANGLLVHMPDLQTAFDSTNYASLDIGSNAWVAMLSDFLAATTGITLTVTISPSGTGTVDVDPAKAFYDNGDVAVLTANAATGYEFSHWVYEGDNYFGNPAELTFESSDGTEEITAVFVELSQLVTISGSLSRVDGNLVQPVLTLIDQSLENILAAFILDGGTASVDFSIQFSPQAVAASYIHGWDNVNENGTLGDAGDYSNCYDSDDVGIECDFTTYTAGQVIDNVDMTLYEITEGSPRYMQLLPHAVIRTGGNRQ
ncbi:MAG: clostripain-related cysteine peptidase [bacterium]